MRVDRLQLLPVNREQLHEVAVQLADSRYLGSGVLADVISLGIDHVSIPWRSGRRVVNTTINTIPGCHRVAVTIHALPRFQRGGVRVERCQLDSVIAGRRFGYIVPDNGFTLLVNHGADRLDHADQGGYPPLAVHTQRGVLPADMAIVAVGGCPGLHGVVLVIIGRRTVRFNELRRTASRQIVRVSRSRLPAVSNIQWVAGIALHLSTCRSHHGHFGIIRFCQLLLRVSLLAL